MLLKVFAAMILLGAILPLPADVVLVKDGVAQSGIVFDSTDKVIGKYAQILSGYVKKSSGAKLPVNGEKLPNTYHLDNNASTKGSTALKPTALAQRNFLRLIPSAITAGQGLPRRTTVR